MDERLVCLPEIPPCVPADWTVEWVGSSLFDDGVVGPADVAQATDAESFVARGRALLGFT